MTTLIIKDLMRKIDDKNLLIQKQSLYINELESKNRDTSSCAGCAHETKSREYINCTACVRNTSDLFEPIEGFKR